MKKIFYVVIIACGVSHTLQAQSFLDKMKAKTAKAIEEKMPAKQAAPSLSSSDTKYTDPAKFGTVLISFTQKEVNDHMAGSGGAFNLWFSSINVVNNQIEAKINDYDKSFGSYSNGQFKKLDGIADVNSQNSIANGSDLETKGKDFSQIDMMNAMLKKGPSVAGARVAGKVGLPYTFKGKALGEYIMAYMIHNPDSSAIALVGQGFAAGAMKYTLALSSGAKVDLPVKIAGFPLISPDGKVGGAFVQSLTGAGGDVYSSLGGKVSIGNFDSNYGLWLHNSGVVYNVNSTDSKEVMKNGQSFIKSNMQIDAKKLFINLNDNTACWQGDHGLYFSDGSIFENGECPHKLTINNKEVIVFLYIDIPTGKLYLCQHDL